MVGRYQMRMQIAVALLVLAGVVGFGGAMWATRGYYERLQDKIRQETAERLKAQKQLEVEVMDDETLIDRVTRPQR